MGWRTPERQAATYYFGEHRFGPHRELWRLDEQVVLRPKTAEVLAHLIDHAGEEVTRAELLDVVWPDGFMGDGAVAVCISELRRALGDDARQPRFVATLHRRGYRFLPAVSTRPPATVTAGGGMVGRGEELAVLTGWWRQVTSGGRGVGFVTAEHGAGKTTLVDVFAADLRDQDGVMMGRGQCVGQHGEGEAYLPLLDALTDLCRGPGGGMVRRVLSSHAPMWLLQLPGLYADSEVGALRARVAGAGPERMLREMADALEAVAARRPLVLVLEDLHDADRSTVVLLDYLGRRRPGTPLLVIGTYRPSLVASADHPLGAVAAELHARGLSHHMMLGPLPEDAVHQYLVDRLAPQVPSPRLVGEIHRRTEGNALFMVTLVDHLVAGGLDQVEERLGDLGVPETLRQSIDRQLASLPAGDRELLGAASVVGVEFTVATAAAGFGAAPDSDVDVEHRCARIAREAALLIPGEDVRWPDETVTASYRFRHALYQQVLYEELGPARRARIHRRVAERLVVGYADRTDEVAGELGSHFARGDLPEQAITHLVRAAETALGRPAPPEVLRHVDQALALLDRLSRRAARDSHELAIRLVEAAAWTAIKGFGAAEVADAYSRARQLADRMDEPDHVLVPVTYGLWNYAFVRAQLDDAAALAERLAKLSGDATDPILEMQMHNSQGQTRLMAGDLAAASAHFQQVLRIYDVAEHGQLALTYGEDPAVLARVNAAATAALAGDVVEASRHVEVALQLADHLGLPVVRGEALAMAGTVYQLAGDIESVDRLAAELARLDAEHDIPLWPAVGTILTGWVAARRGEPLRGAELIRTGLGHWEAAGVEVTRPYYETMLAEALDAAGDTVGALDAVTAAGDTARRTGEVWYLTEILRMRAGYLARLGLADTATVEAILVEAVDTAQAQGAHTLGTRASADLLCLRGGVR